MQQNLLKEDFGEEIMIGRKDKAIEDFNIKKKSNFNA
jgi:hypothetical protein